MAYTPDYCGSEPTRTNIDGGRGVLLIEFGATWCGHCIGAQAAIEAALSTREDVVHLKIEDGRGKPLGRSFRVKFWPTLVLLRDGVEVARAVRPVVVEDVARMLATS